MPRRSLRVALVVPLAAVVLTGCGSDGERPRLEASADPPPAAESSQRLREDLAAACLDDDAEDGPGAASADPIGSHEGEPSSAPDLSWLDAGDDASTAEALEAAVAGARSDLDLTVTVGLRDRTAGSTEIVGAPRTYPAASLSKVPVVMTFLDQLREEDLELTDEDRELVEATLVRSDNEAASQLYLRLGPTEAEQAAALQETLDLLGAEHGATSTWPGSNPTSAADQLLVLEALREPPPWLHADDAELITELLAVPREDGEQPDESQDFGVGSLALPLDAPQARDVHVKNGWIDDSYEGTGTWSAGSAGFARVDDADLDLVIQLDGASSYECAFSALDALAHVSAQTAGS